MGQPGQHQRPWPLSDDRRGDRSSRLHGGTSPTCGRQQERNSSHGMASVEQDTASALLATANNMTAR